MEDTVYLLSKTNWPTSSSFVRYYYKREILERVDGRRLVYKFGKNSSGWKIEEIGVSMWGIIYWVDKKQKAIDSGCLETKTHPVKPF